MIFFTKVNKIKNQKYIFLFSLSQNHNYNSFIENELTHIFDN
jgi:hypothetical protein